MTARFGIQVDSDNGVHVRFRLFAATGGQHLGGCGFLTMTAEEYSAFRELLAPRLADRPDPPASSRQVQFTGTNLGPYETEQDTRSEPLSREVDRIHAEHHTSPDLGRLVDDATLRHLRAACTDAGVELGAFDERVLAWLAQWEASNVQVVIGLIGRAYAAGVEQRVVTKEG